ncbi:hypothetical protein [Bacteroides sp. MSB163]
MKTKQKKGDELMTSNYIRFFSVLNEMMICQRVFPKPVRLAS